MPVIIKPAKLGIMTKVEPQKTGGTFVVTALGLFRLHDPSDFMSDQALWPMTAKELPPGAVLDVGSAKVKGEIMLAGHAAAPPGQTAKAMAVGIAVGDKVIDLVVYGDRYWSPSHNGIVFTEPRPFETMPIWPERAFGGPGHAGNPSGRGHNALVRMHQAEPVLLPNVEYRSRLIRHVDDAPPPALVGPVDLQSPERIKLLGTYDNNWVKDYHPGLPPDADPHIFNLAPPEQRIFGYFRGDEAFHAVGMSPQHAEIKGALPGFRVRCLVERSSAPAGLCELGMRIDTLWFFAGVGLGIVVYRGAMAIEDPDALDVKALLLAYERMTDEPRPAAHFAEIITARQDREKAFKYVMADAALSPPPDPEAEARRRRLREAYNAQIVDRFHKGQIWYARRQAAEAGVPPALIPDIPRPEPLPILLPTPEELESGNVDFAEIVDGIEKMQKDMLERYGPLQDELRSRGVEAIIRDPRSIIAKALPPEQASDATALIDKTLSPDAMISLGDGAPDPVRARLAELAGRSASPLDLIMADPQDQLRDACARFDTSRAAHLLSGARQQLAAMKPGEGAPPSTPVAAGGPAALLEALSQNPQSKARAETAFAKAGLTQGGVSLTLDKLLGAADALPAGGGGTAAGLARAGEVLDQGEARLEEGLAQLRQVAMEAVYPEQPLSPPVAERFGAYVMKRFGAGETLAGRDLAGACLRGADLQGVDLSGAFLENTDLRGAKLAGAQCVKTAFTGALLDGADFRQANLNGANLSCASARGASFAGAAMQKIVAYRVNVEGADLRGAHVSEVNLIHPQLAGAQLRGARLSKIIVVQANLDHLDAEEVHLEECQFVETSLAGARLARAQVIRCVFLSSKAPGLVAEEAELTNTVFLVGTDLTAARFAGARGKNVTFQGVTLAEADLSGVRFDECTFGDADLTRASMRLASLKRSLFGNSTLEGVDLFGANLLEAQLRRARLKGANLRSANLYCADLTMADLVAVDLTGANVARTSLMVPADAH